MYTSGSTGRPKAVGIPHRGVVRLVQQSQVFQFSPQEVFLQLAPLSFDVSTLEIWGSLLHGGRLVLFPGGLPSPHTLAQLLQQEQITTLWLTAGFFHQMVEYQVSALLQIPQLTVGADVLSAVHVRKLFDAGFSGRLINGYGPTENTSLTTCYALSPGDPFPDQSIPIGGAIPYTQVYVLDPQMQLVPIGVSGELYIAGAGLARGYLNDVGLTAEKFVPNPFASQPGERLYQTGDRVRLRAEGQIEFLGRLDEQVKIRGFRVELAEVERALEEHPAVRQSAVLVREESAQEKHLVGYLVLRPEQTAGVSELRAFVQQRLPAYMLPSAFVVLDVLPLTPHGKLDRQALPAPSHQRPGLAREFVPPSTITEQVLAEIWSEVLDLEQIGIHDNFFELGGNSLNAIQILVLAQEKNLNPTLEQFFQHQTIYTLAQELIHSDRPLPLVAPKRVEDAFPLLKLQLEMLLSSEEHACNALISHHLQAHFDFRQMHKVLEHLLSRHPILRISFDFESFSEALQLINNTVQVLLQVEDLRHLDTLEQEKILSAWLDTEKARGFDQTQPPFIRFQIHLLTDEQMQLTLSFHCALIDRRSADILLAEFYQLYDSLLSNSASSLLPPPGIRIRDIVAMEQEALSSEQAKQYWLQRLQGSLPPQLQRWFQPRQDTHLAFACTRQIPLAQEVADDLERLALVTSVALETVLLTAHLWVISKINRSEYVITGLVTDISPEVVNGERALGPFSRALPYQQTLSGGSWVELIRETFETEQGLLSLQQYPLAQIQQDLGMQKLFEMAIYFAHPSLCCDKLKLENIAFLDKETIFQTNLAFQCCCIVDPTTSSADLTLEYNADSLNDAQVDEIVGYYIRSLTAMATEPFGNYNLEKY